MPSTPDAMISTGTIRNSVSAVAEKEAVVVRGASRAMRKPRQARIAYRHGDDEQPRGAELLADGGQHQIGVAGRQIARVAEAEAGAEPPPVAIAQIACAT